MTTFDPAHVSPAGPGHDYPPGRLTVTKLSVGPMDNNAYLLVDPATRSAVLVDAANEPDRLLELLGDLRLEGVLTTHRHQDHTGALRAVLAARPDAWSGAHEADAPALPVRPSRTVQHGQEVAVGDAAIRVLHTPGHTPGSICLLLPDAQVLTGDALFPGGVGATQGRAAFEQAVASVERELLSLPEETRISPGHGDDTYVGAELPQLPAWKERGW